MLHDRLSKLVLVLGCALLLPGCGVKWDSSKNQGSGGWVDASPGPPLPTMEEEYERQRMLAERKARADSLAEKMEQEKRAALARFQSTPEYQEYSGVMLEMEASFAEGAVVEESDPSSVIPIWSRRPKYQRWEGTFTEGAVLAAAALPPGGNIDRRSWYGECVKTAVLTFTGAWTDGKYERRAKARLFLDACDGDGLWRDKAETPASHDRYIVEQRGNLVRLTSTSVYNLAPIYLTREGNRMYGTAFELWYQGRWVYRGGGGVEARAAMGTLELRLVP